MIAKVHLQLNDITPQALHDLSVNRSNTSSTLINSLDLQGQDTPDLVAAIKHFHLESKQFAKWNRCIQDKKDLNASTCAADSVRRSKVLKDLSRIMVQVLSLVDIKSLAFARLAGIFGFEVEKQMQEGAGVGS